MTKIMVMKYDYIYPEFNNTLIEIKKVVESLIEKYGENAVLDIDNGDVTYYREETDEEYEKRIKQHEKNVEKRKQQKIKNDQKERKLYENLKKKYESNE